MDANDRKIPIPFIRETPNTDPSLKVFLDDIRQRVQEVIVNTTIPGQTTGLTLSDVGTNVKITWNSVFNAHTYWIYRNTSREFTTSTIVAIVIAPCRVFYDGIDTSTTFYYWVRAVNSLGKEGPISAMSSIAV